jgi:methylthioribose-1-phosphate isomerase
LDQTLLPTEERWLRLETADAVAEAICSLRVRGAPAIGIAGAYGLAVGAAAALRADHDQIGAAFDACRDMLLATRPTGRNLGWALERVSRAFHGALGDRPEAAVSAARAEADAVARDEVAMCQRIGEWGLTLMPEEGATVMTHCNAGALATAGLGTALAPIYLAHREGRSIRVAATETRPVLQGARLTTWELSRAGVDATLLTDSMAGALFQKGGVNLVVVGADRIAANGDVANKIGTYALAVLAAHHGIPFYVAAPRSTFDRHLASGDDIEIELRDEDEVRRGLGRTTVPEGVSVWNPAFDVTPATLVTAIVTDGGILRPPYGPAIRRLLDADRAGAEQAAPEIRGEA